MAASYDEAVAELYQAPHASFVVERKRLAADLKTAGDKSGATKLGKLPRPPISAWAVNQLWWQAQEDVESMLESAAQLRDGELAGAAGHRETIAKLRHKAAAILTEGGNAATEATLRRVTTTLSAIAASGGFDPDPPGCLGDDRDPPGFEAIGIGAGPSPAPAPRPAPKKAKKPADDDDDDDDDAPADDGGDAKATAKREATEARRRDAEAAREKAEADSARRRAEDEAARRRTERHRLEAALRNEQGEIEAKRREMERLGKMITNLEESILQAQASVVDIEKRLAELDDE